MINIIKSILNSIIKDIDAGNSNFDYAKMSDSEAEEAREGLVEEKGFFILPSELFCNVRKSASDEKAFFTDREGKRKSEDIMDILEASDRCKAGKTAPPEGLYLKDVFY